MTDYLNAEFMSVFSELDRDSKESVLAFMQTLNRSKTGTSGNVVASFAGKIPAEELEAMQVAIEAGCEQVDSEDW